MPKLPMRSALRSHWSVAYKQSQQNFQRNGFALLLVLLLLPIAALFLR